MVSASKTIRTGLLLAFMLAQMPLVWADAVAEAGLEAPAEVEPLPEIDASPSADEVARTQPEVEVESDPAPETEPAVLAPVVGPSPREWTLLGELYFPATATSGLVSLSFNDVRRRNGHYEVWERIRFLPRKPGEALWLDDEGAPKERLTLWAVRCGRGMMARLLEATDGAFGPRAEVLRFFAPLPESVGAEVMDALCRVMRERAESGETPEALEARHFKKKQKGFEAPPLILDAADLDEDDALPGAR